MSESSISTSTSTPAVFDSSALKVPDEPGVYFCAKHKNVKTRLRCGRCEKPICPKCTRMGPTGARCADCLSNRGSHMYQVSAGQFLMAFGTAFGCSLLAALLASSAGFFFFLILYAPVAGTMIGKAIVRVVKGKRGTPLALVSCAGVLAGAFVPLDVIFMHAPTAGHFLNPYLWIYIVLTISGVWYWVR